MDKMKQICERIKDLREFSDYSVAEFSNMLGITESEYVEFENGAKEIPINLIFKVSTALEIDPSVIIMGKNSTNKTAAVSYNGKGEKVNRYEGYSFVSLASEFMNREMEPMIVTIKEGIEPELVEHEGQEFNYVLSGGLRVIVGEKEYYLRKGDSIYFDASIPHAQCAMKGGSGSSKFITVIQSIGGRNV